MTPVTKSGVVLATITGVTLIVLVNVFLIVAGYPPQWVGSIIGLLVGGYISHMLCELHVL